MKAVECSRKKNFYSIQCNELLGFLRENLSNIGRLLVEHIEHKLIVAQMCVEQIEHQ